MNGELTKHLTKKPFYSVDYFFMDDVYIDAPIIEEDVKEIFKYTDSMMIETYQEERNIETMEDFNRFVSVLKYDCPSSSMVVDTIRFCLDETKQTWFDLSNKCRVTKQELVS